jgi:putative ABC transport system permease protein
LIAPALPERHLDSPNDVRIIILIILAGIILAGSACGKTTGPGSQVNSGKLLTLEISLPESKYADETQRVAFFREALERIKALPGVESVGAVSTPPLSDNKQSVRFTIEPTTGEEIDAIPAGFNVVSPGYFQTLMVPLIAGRTLTEADSADTVRVVVINETLARRFFPNQDPIGKRVQFGDLEEQASSVTIVGVVGDVKYSDSADPEPEFYISYLQASLPVMTIVVRADGDARELAGSVEREVKAVDGDVTVSNIGTMN